MERHPLGIALTTPIQKKKRLTRKIIELSGLFPRGGRGGGVLPYISHIGMCRPIHFAHFGLESGMVCLRNRKELRECMNVFIVSIPNE